MKMSTETIESNVRQAEAIWGSLPESEMLRLRDLVGRYKLSVAAGHLQRLSNSWYITHAGLLSLAQRQRCAGISVHQVRNYCDAPSGRWMFRATVYKSRNARGFVGYGDADPSNVSPVVRGAEMRVAETRAVNRALRKAYGIGLCSVEELAWSPKSSNTPSCPTDPFKLGGNGHHNGQPRLRDQLCLLIRQYNLDPNLVKAYAADFCGTETLKGASRELVESFISHISSSAKEDLAGLICKLNSYSRPVEAKQ